MSKRIGGEKFGEHWGAWFHAYINPPHWRGISFNPQFECRYIYSERSIDFRISFELDLFRYLIAFGISREPYHMS